MSGPNKFSSASEPTGGSPKTGSGDPVAPAEPTEGYGATRVLGRDASAAARRSVAPRPPSGETFGDYLLVGQPLITDGVETFLAVRQGPEGFVKVVTLKRPLPAVYRSRGLLERWLYDARLGVR